MEAFFFTSFYPSSGIFAEVIFMKLVLAAAEAAAAVYLFSSSGSSRPLLTVMSTFFSYRSTGSWIWRICLASILYFPVYLFFGAIIGPSILPYYTDPSLGLTIPSFSIILPLELFRGFLYVCTLVPWIAVLNISRKKMAAVLASLLYIPGGLVPLLTTHSLPAQIIPYHLGEIFCDSVVYAILVTLVITLRQSRCSEK